MIDQNMEGHPFANELPDLTQEQYEELRDDIKRSGLKERVMIYQGMILDGRHRARALEELGIGLTEGNTEEYDPSIDGHPAR